MFVEIDPLPGTECQSAVANRNVQGYAHETALDVPGHVIVTFECVLECAISIPLGRYELVESCFHVRAYIWIGVLVDR